jgi:hypothetical protein
MSRQNKAFNQSLFKQNIKGNNYLAIKSNGKTKPNDVDITSKISPIQMKRLRIQMM